MTTSPATPSAAPAATPSAAPASTSSTAKPSAYPQYPQYPQQGYPAPGQGYPYPGHQQMYQAPSAPIAVQEEKLSFCAEFGIRIAVTLVVVFIIACIRILLTLYLR